MDPKKIQEIREAIDRQLGPQTLYALACYANLLYVCGVKKINVFRIAA